MSRFFCWRREYHAWKSGIVYVIRNGLQWKDASKSYGPHKALYNRFIRWSCLGVFDRIFVVLTEQASRSKLLMIDTIHFKVHRASTGLLKKGLFPAISDGQKAA
ncbi:transposase [Gluconobacter sphaericus]|uniref:transposase n=1 Tax=Gluconobacter sphaericus TaxID=574987 RepID=UPI001B8CF365|nr:transposase [Gluconobacter sphaericus]MBS1086110.1 transposase [Gluconobacter sphaericus]MBS1099897.1 transposase [Gluconobacter sphaericus]